MRISDWSSDGCSSDLLRSNMLEEVGDSRLFQRMMAENALRHRPPVGRFRDFVVTRKGDGKATLDLKVQGLTPFVDGARLLALGRSEERRVGKECVSTCRSRLSRDH